MTELADALFEIRKSVMTSADRRVMNRAAQAQVRRGWTAREFNRTPRSNLSHHRATCGSAGVPGAVGGHVDA